MISKFNKPEPPTRREYQTPDTQLRYNDFCKCDHEWILYKRERSNGAIFYQSFCSLCGEPGAVQKKKELTEQQIKIASSNCNYEYIQDLRNEHNKQKLEKYNKYIAKARDEVSETWQNWYYNEYLQSSVWKEKASKVKKRAKGVCECCLERKAEQIHHLSYQHVGREPLFELVAICTECHKDIHQV